MILIEVAVNEAHDVTWSGGVNYKGRAELGIMKRAVRVFLVDYGQVLKAETIKVLGSSRSLVLLSIG